MNKWLVLEALKMAVEHRRPGLGLIHHSDRDKPASMPVAITSGRYAPMTWCAV